MPLNVFEFFPVINYMRNYSLSAISTFFLSFNFYQKNAVKCSQPLFINLQYSSKVDGQSTRKTFARLACSAQKKGRVLREFFHSFNAVSLFCSALFWKTKVFCLKMLPLKHQINMCISQYQKDTRAAVRKGRARLREQGALKAAVPSMRPSDKTVEWEVAKPQV